MTMKRERDLLESLQNLVGCEYLSDLKSDTQRGRLLQTIGKMELSDFPLSVWEDAISYLFQTEDVRFCSPEDLRAFLQTRRADDAANP